VDRSIACDRHVHPDQLLQRSAASHLQSHCIKNFSVGLSTNLKDHRGGRRYRQVTRFLYACLMYAISWFIFFSIVKFYSSLFLIVYHVFGEQRLLKTADINSVVKPWELDFRQLKCDFFAEC